MAASEPGGSLSWSLLAALDEALNSTARDAVGEEVRSTK
jgi:hypothetical protein